MIYIIYNPHVDLARCLLILFYLFIHISAWLSICLPVYQPICLPVYVFTYLPPYLSICLLFSIVYLSNCVAAYLSIYLSFITANELIYLFIYLDTRVSVRLPAYQYISSSFYQSICLNVSFPFLLVYLSNYLAAYLFTCLPYITVNILIYIFFHLCTRVIFIFDFY